MANAVRVRKDYCWQHFEVPEGADVRASTLPGAGMGLFVYNPFRKGQKVAEYSGKIVSARKVKDSQYVVAWKHGKVVDESSSQNGANTCRGVDKKWKRCKGTMSELQGT